MANEKALGAFNDSVAKAKKLNDKITMWLWQQDSKGKTEGIKETVDWENVTAVGELLIKLEEITEYMGL